MSDRPFGEKSFTYHPNLRNAGAYRDNFDTIFRKKAKCRDCGAEHLEKELKDGVCETCTKPLESP